MSKENNKMQVDIDNLFKQNVNDLLSIKELYSKLEELQEKITQIKYIDNTLVKKLKKEYENLKKVILDENVQVELNNKIEETKTELNEVSSQLETKVNKINKIETINAKEIGADNKGVSSCTDLIQNYINNGYSIYFPQGIYKLNISLAPKITIQGEGLGLVTLIPEDLNKDVIKATRECYSYTVKDLSIDGKNEMGKNSYTANGIYLSSEGTLASQDLEPHLENIKIINVKTGLKIDDTIRGGLFKNIKAGACNVGIDHRSTDCIFKDCVTAQTQSHGIFNLNANNTFINCKPFLAGLSKKEGAGIKNQGSYNRFINCECQQNVLENFHIQNGNYNIIQGLILDGAGYNSKNWFPSMTYQETGGEVPISSLRLYNSKGNIIDCNIIDGRLDSYCKTAIYNQWVGNDKENIIRANINNATEDSTMTNYSFNDENKYFKNNSITINGVLMKDKALKKPTIIDEQVEITSGGYIVDNGICYISMSLKALKTQTWGNEFLSGMPIPINNIPLICSKADLRCSLNVSGKITYNPSISEGDTFNISATYIIK